MENINYNLKYIYTYKGEYSEEFLWKISKDK